VVENLDRPAYSGVMPKRSSNPRDLNQLAARLVQKATTDEPESDPYEGKNPAAVELGRLGAERVGRLVPRS